jgi:hypothetical protein
MVPGFVGVFQESKVMGVCLNLKAFCLRHEWAASTFALLGVGLLLGSVWALLDSYGAILMWIERNFLVHGLLFGAAMLADVLLIFGCLCLGFSECSREDRNCVYAFRGRRTPLVPELTRLVEHLGRNPRRQPRRA